VRHSILSESKLSRRDFLKLLGAGAVMGVVGKFASFGPTGSQSKSQLASAQTSDPWAAGPDLSIPCVHATLLPNGQIMYSAGSGWQHSSVAGPFKSGVLSNPDTSSETISTQPDDLFCCNFAPLANGNVLITGGTLLYNFLSPDGSNLWHGGNFAYEYDLATNQFYKMHPMAHGRWYPSMTTLSDGTVAISNGYDEFGALNLLTEIYDPRYKTFSIKYDSGSNLTYTVGLGKGINLPGAGQVTYGGPNKGVNPTDTTVYSRMILMPSGLVFRAGQRDALSTWNPATGHWVSAGAMGVLGRTYGTSVLLPLHNNQSERGKVLIAAGQPTDGGATLNSAQIADFDAGTNTAPIINFTNNLTYARMYPLPVFLPTGKVVLFGGTSDANITYVKAPELFNPDDNTWTVLPSANVGRQYHSVAMLLPDGRVWTAGGTPDTGHWTPSTEFYRPPYYFDSSRPTISGSSTVGNYGGSITIQTPDAASITSVSLVKLGNVTHHFDWSHRFVWLQIQGSTSSSVTVAAPLNGNIAPPGYYMIFILNSSGTPSIGKIIQIGQTPIPTNPDTTPPTIGIYSPSSRASIVGPSSGVPVTVLGTSSDTQTGVSSVVVSIDGGTTSPATPRSGADWSTWSFSTVIKSMGPHTIKAIATDVAGNKSSVTIPVTIFFG